ncbi:MAG TPA: isoaspartyl peptidase/L-asparaginase [Gammaproteobacteria bacterium]|nr:isoaspartyl peptidase/L-asparaginase [Gammaproteobacteria bacterium]
MSNAAADASPAAGRSPIAIAVHGGAGTIRAEEMTPEKEAAYRAALEQALKAGYAMLESGGTSLAAVVAAVKVLEDSPLFNAGKGAVFNAEGKHELDAAVMEGRLRRAGAVAGLTRIRNPIELARLVMEKSRHVMLVGGGAEQFAAEQGMEFVTPDYFYTEERWQQWQRVKAAEQAAPPVTGVEPPGLYDTKFGTVGAVALDRNGDLAAATSTGGLTNKRYGRVGDAPIIGAGTWADNAGCAVSATGHGEYFIRNAVAHDISALMQYRGMSVKQAAEYVVLHKLVEHGGEGGVIAIDRRGNIAMPFNTTGMYRGAIDTRGRLHVAIYRE